MKWQNEFNFLTYLELENIQLASYNVCSWYVNLQLATESSEEQSSKYTHS
jgi:hypothetical protein